MRALAAAFRISQGDIVVAQNWLSDRASLPPAELEKVAAAAAAAEGDAATTAEDGADDGVTPGEVEVEGGVGEAKRDVGSQPAIPSALTCPKGHRLAWIWNDADAFQTVSCGRPICPHQLLCAAIPL